MRIYKYKFIKSSIENKHILAVLIDSEKMLLSIETQLGTRRVQDVSTTATCWDSARVIEREKHFASRKIKESLHIERSVNCINTDPGYYMHPVWFTTLQSMPR